MVIIIGLATASISQGLMKESAKKSMNQSHSSKKINQMIKQ